MENNMDMNLIIIVVSSVAAVLILASFAFRRVVPTNEVHIVQTGKKTIDYGKDAANGNVYYEWPSWIPGIGITKVVLPLSIFGLDLIDYEAYDKGRLPFIVDVKAFFRIFDSKMAANRISNFKELTSQLLAVVQGAVRTILASSDIEEIMQGRSKFGQEFTVEVNEQLSQWGVATVKNLELMDIRDSHDSRVIHNIMAKKKSLIEMESRTEVASNMKQAQTAEIEAEKLVQLQRQNAEKEVGLQKAQLEREVGIANQQANQHIKEAEKETKRKEMDVEEVQKVRLAEIVKQASVVKAEEEKATAILAAEKGLETKRLEKEALVLQATGELEAKKLQAQGITSQGKAEADAVEFMQMASVTAQTKLAEAIGKNPEYQSYLIETKKIEAGQTVGVEQAKALNQAQVKIIASAGKPTDGLNSVADLFSVNGGVGAGSMLEGLALSDAGKALLKKVGLNNDEVSSTSK